MKVKFDVSTTFDKHFDNNTKILISQGGGRSGKTYSIIQILILEALQNNNFIISIVAENMPFLKRGAIRDFIQIMQSSGLYEDRRWNKTDSVYKFPSGSIIEFFSVENPGRALGSARDRLFVNECNNVHFETAFQLIARTRGKVYLDYNPTGEFWVQEEIINNKQFRNQYELIITTYKDNEFLDKSIIELMLARASKDRNYKRVYVDGQMGVAEGLIYGNYKLIDHIPDDVINRSNIQYFSLDFGYSNDPSSLNSIYVLGDSKQPVKDVYVDEIVYQNELTNRQLSKYIKNNLTKNNYRTVADSAEPKSIDEIFSYGVNIEGIKKGPDSLAYGIGLLQQANIYVTKNSLNTIKELRNYKWATDRYGRPMKDSKGRTLPIDLWNHSLDGIRYVCMYVNDQKFNYRDVPRGRTTKGLVAV